MTRSGFVTITMALPPRTPWPCTMSSPPVMAVNWCSQAAMVAASSAPHIHARLTWGIRTGDAGGRRRACCRGRGSQGASQTAYVGESSRGEPPVLGIDGLLAVVVVVRRLREVQAGADKGGERCLEMLPCPLEPAGAGDRAGVGVVPGGEPGAGGPSAGRAGRADGACDGRERG